MEKVEIIKGKPIPEQSKYGKGFRPARYPWREMEEGDCFEMVVTAGSDKAELKRMRMLVAQYNFRMKKENDPRRFKLAQDEDSVWHVWRIA